jgi:hypothetical protein
MAYTSGGIIQALDYNLLAWGGNTTSSYAGTPQNLAYIWGLGYGYKGYGQTTSLIPAVTATSTITATQWAGLVYTLNRCLGHQSGAGGQLATGSNIGITAGATVTAFSNVTTAITSTIHTNANTYTASGSTTTGSNFTPTFAGGVTGNSGAPGTTSNGQTENAYNTTITRTVTFASADQARYFFNAGGRLQFVISSVSNGTGSQRGADIVTLLQTNLAGITVGGSATSYQGSGGTVNTNNTSLGYWNQTTSNQTVAQVTSTNATYYQYRNDYAYLQVKTNGVQGSNGDKGTVMTFTLYVETGSMTGPQYDQTFSAVITHRIDVLPPETTYLANTWGSITIA